MADKPLPRARKTSVSQGPGHGGPANGPGWGGPARGAGEPFSAINQPAPEAKAAGLAEAKTSREIAKPLVSSMLEVWRAIAIDPNAPHMARVAAAERIVDRAEGKPTQHTEHSGEMTQRVISGEPLTPEQWAQRYEANDAA